MLCVAELRFASVDSFIFVPIIAVSCFLHTAVPFKINKRKNQSKF